MKKEIRLVDKEKGILQVTTTDERWYARSIENPTTGLPEYEFVPSVTWICDHYPKGVAFYKWLASKGWDEAQSIKESAGDRGSRVHYAIRDLIEGREVKIDSPYKTVDSEEARELSLDEYECLMSFTEWVKDAKPKFEAWEFQVWGDGYAGSVDLYCTIDGIPYVVDFKTSQSVQMSHRLQVSAYKNAGEFPENTKLAILQVGYKLNKKRYKFTEVEDQYNEFLAAKIIWANENKGVKPQQKNYPLKLKLDQGEKQ